LCKCDVNICKEKVNLVFSGISIGTFSLLMALFPLFYEVTLCADLFWDRAVPCPEWRAFCTDGRGYGNSGNNKVYWL